ncbi:hypothetical protein ABKN59_003497 [Abortiporus biennis]
MGHRLIRVMIARIDQVYLTIPIFVTRILVLVLYTPMCRILYPPCTLTKPVECQNLKNLHPHFLVHVISWHDGEIA